MESGAVRQARRELAVGRRGLHSMEGREEEEGAGPGASQAATARRGWAAGAVPPPHWRREEPLPREAADWRGLTSIRGARALSRAP